MRIDLTEKEVTEAMQFYVEKKMVRGVNVKQVTICSRSDAMLTLRVVESDQSELPLGGQEMTR